MNCNEENKVLINDILDRNFYRVFKDENLYNERMISFDIQPTKDILDDSCYSYDYNNIHIDGKEILNNFLSFLRFYKKNKFRCPIQLIGGDWLHNPDGAILFLSSLYNIFENSFIKPNYIIIVDNMDFLDDFKLNILIQEIISKLNNININVIFKALVQPKPMSTKSGVFYSALNNFSQKIPVNVVWKLKSDDSDKFDEGLKWWVENANKKILQNMIIKEDEKSNWTKHSLENISNFYLFLLNNIKKYFKTNAEFFDFIINKKADLNFPLINISILNLDTSFLDRNDCFKCEAYHALNIRLADLSVNFCHCINDGLLSFGKYTLDETNEIIDFEPENPSLFVAKEHLKRGNLSNCMMCHFAGLCDVSCLGSNYHESSNFFIPAFENCCLAKTKYSIIFNYLRELNFVEFLNNDAKEYLSNKQIYYFNKSFDSLSKKQEYQKNKFNKIDNGGFLNGNISK